MTKALIFGINGQDGSYLAEFLIEKGYEVFGVVRHHATGPALDNIAAETLEHLAAMYSGDLTDEATVRSAIHSCRPDEVYNLAAQSFVAPSWGAVESVMAVNLMGAATIFRAVADLAPYARVYQASSSEMYGRDTPPPQTEHSLMRPVSPYGVSKLAAHHMANIYRLSRGLFVSCGILFNHESPRRGPYFVSRKIAAGVARITCGLQDTLTLGEMMSRRDWGWAPDYVRAMWMMLQQDMPDDFVIATGESHSVGEFAQSGFRHVGITDWQPYIRTDPALYRVVDIPRLVGSATKAHRALGWRHEVGFDEIVARMVDVEIERAKAWTTP